MPEKTFLNMPVEGEVYVPSYSKVKQLSQDEVEQLFELALIQPELLGIGWTQYTPYFNDGEPCVFHAGDVYFAIEGANKVEDDYCDYAWMEDDFNATGRIWLEPYHPEFERLVGNSERDRTTLGYKVALRDQVKPNLGKALTDLRNAIGSGSCNNVLLQKFGDHATILIDKEKNKVVIEEYGHD